MLNFRRYEPIRELKEYVHGYWHIKSGPEPELLDFVPDGHPELYFILKGGMQYQCSNGEMKSCPPFGVIGQLSSQFFTLTEPNTEAFYAKLYPWSPFPFFSVPFWEMNDQMAELDLTGKSATMEMQALGRDVISSENVFKAIHLLDQFLLRKAANLKSENPFVNFAVRKIYQTNGTISMEELTRHIHASRRYVEKVFKKHIGMSPKRYARLIRVKKASLLLLEDNFTGNISQVAASLDYYDQSHFLKDFKAVVCRTPSEFLRQKGNLSFDELESYLRQWDYS